MKISSRWKVALRFLPVVGGGVAACALPLVLAGCALPESGGSRTTAELLDVFPPSTAQVAAELRGESVISSNYTESGSLWWEGLDERAVFHAELAHRQGADNSFALRVGRGGQIYSLRGAFGESVPPSNLGSPWNDEVWQFVAVCSRYNGVGALPKEVAQRFNASPFQSWFFVHNSGAYIESDSALKNIYCPLLASGAAADGRAYRTVNWGLVPQSRTINRSPLLYYCQTRDVGDGVIELTWVVHNFSVRDDVVFDHLNAPWGGTRISSLPVHYVSTPEGGLLTKREMQKRNYGGGVGVRETGGWNLSCVAEAPDSPSLALVFGRDRHLESELEKARAGKSHVQISGSLYRDWDVGGDYTSSVQDWETRPANTWRNYDVAVVIPKFRLIPGSTIWYRSFLIVNRKDRAIELAKQFTDQVDYGLLTFDPATTPKVPVFIKDARVVERGGKPAFVLFSKPVPGSLPLFLIEDSTTGREVVTTDPYRFVPNERLDFGVPKDDPKVNYYVDARGYSLDRHHSRWKRLLGYGLRNKPAEGSFVRLSEPVDASLFPAADAWHLDLWVARDAGGGNR